MGAGLCVPCSLQRASCEQWVWNMETQTYSRISQNIGEPEEETKPGAPGSEDCISHLQNWGQESLINSGSRGGMGWGVGAHYAGQ